MQLKGIEIVQFDVWTESIRRHKIYDTRSAQCTLTHTRENTTQTYGSINSKAFSLCLCLCRSTRIYPRNTLETHWKPNEANQIERSWMDRRRTKEMHKRKTKYGQRKFHGIDLIAKHMTTLDGVYDIACNFKWNANDVCSLFSALLSVPMRAIRVWAFNYFYEKILNVGKKIEEKNKRRQNTHDTHWTVLPPPAIYCVTFIRSLAFPFRISVSHFETTKKPTNQPIYGVNLLELNFLVFYTFYFSLLLIEQIINYGYARNMNF